MNLFSLLSLNDFDQDEKIDLLNKVVEKIADRIGCEIEIIGDEVRLIEKGKE